MIFLRRTCQALTFGGVLALAGNASLPVFGSADYGAAPAKTERPGHVDASGFVVRDAGGLARAMFFDSTVSVVLAGRFVEFREDHDTDEAVGLLDVDRVLKGTGHAGVRVHVRLDEGILEAEGTGRTRAFRRGEDVTTAWANTPPWERAFQVAALDDDFVWRRQGITIDDERGAIRLGQTLVLGLASRSTGGFDAVHRSYPYVVWGDEAHRVVDIFERESALTDRCTQWRHPWHWGQSATQDFFLGVDRIDLGPDQHVKVEGAKAGLVQRCLDDGADPNARLSGGRTPLHWAAGHAEELDAVLALLDAGADADLAAQDEWGGTPVDYAAGNRHGNAAILKALLAAGGAVGGTHRPMHSAAVNENPEMIRILTEAGADPNVRASPSGQTVFHAAAGHCGLYEDVYCRDMEARVELLLAAGADLSLRDIGGATALHRAAQDANPASVRALIAAGMSVAAQDNHGAMPLHYAARGRDPAVVEALLAAAADATARDVAGATPLHWAARSRARDFAEVVKALLQSGADVDARDDNGQTPLHYAESPHRAVDLIAAGVDPNVKDASGRTAAEARAELVGSEAVGHGHLWAVGYFDDDRTPDEVFFRPVSSGGYRLWARLSTRPDEPLALAELDSIFWIGVRAVGPGTYLTACAKGHGTRKCGGDEHVRLDRDGVLLFRDESAASLFHLADGAFVRTWVSD